jgi:hypothetical protein
MPTETAQEDGASTDRSHAAGIGQRGHARRDRDEDDRDDQHADEADKEFADEGDPGCGGRPEEAERHARDQPGKDALPERDGEPAAG